MDQSLKEQSEKSIVQILDSSAEEMLRSFCDSPLQSPEPQEPSASSEEHATEGPETSVIALFTIIRTDRNMLLACYSHKHISYRIRTIIRKAIIQIFCQPNQPHIYVFFVPMLCVLGWKESTILRCIFLSSSQQTCLFS
ncbi:hypothetical protein [Wolbachia endosymbiont (group A) of Scambus nigricans]|uniref:hypothetical protein n=1 Tax=Wolbachia endosymbiont (group A) of Scambus nigricans TaxID=2954055 RepID=UPI002230566A|nr:hypothetical protein [Wolbachia endosymbiont (group A) of Scambus nigricans]